MVMDILQEIGNAASGAIDTVGGAINSAGEAVSNYVDEVADEWNEADGLGKLNMVADTGLDILGFVPVVGAAADGVHAAKYAIQGDPAMAAVYGACAIPVAGDAVALGKIGVKAVETGVKATEKAAAKEGTEVVAETASKEITETASKEAAEKTAEASAKIGASSLKDNFSNLYKAVREEQSTWSPLSRKLFTSEKFEKLFNTKLEEGITAKSAAKTVGKAAGAYGVLDFGMSTVTKAFADEANGAESMLTQDEFAEVYADTYAGSYAEAMLEDSGLDANSQYYKTQYDTYYNDVYDESYNEVMNDSSIYDSYVKDYKIQNGDTENSMDTEDTASTFQTQDTAAKTNSEITGNTDTSNTDSQELTEDSTGVGQLIDDIGTQFNADMTQEPWSSIKSVVVSLGNELNSLFGPIIAQFTGQGTQSQVTEEVTATQSENMLTAMNSQYGTDATDSITTEQTVSTETASAEDTYRLKADTANVNYSSDASKNYGYGF